MGADQGQVAGWLQGRLPDAWFTGPAEVTVDREEIMVIGTLAAPEGVEGERSLLAAPVPQGASEQETSRGVAAQTRNAARLMSVPGAIGHAVGLGGNGVAVKVYVEEMTDRARQGAPAALDGVPVIVEAIGRVMAIGSMAGACRSAR